MRTNQSFFTSGFIGDWCHIDFDDCAVDPCSNMHYCVDRVDAFDCNIHIPKLMAVIFCPLLALVVLGYVLRRLVLHLNERRISRSR